jgi:hypothetical protein
VRRGIGDRRNWDLSFEDLFVASISAWRGVAGDSLGVTNNGPPGFGGEATFSAESRVSGVLSAAGFIFQAPGLPDKLNRAQGTPVIDDQSLLRGDVKTEFVRIDLEKAEDRYGLESVDELTPMNPDT